MGTAIFSGVGQMQGLRNLPPTPTEMVQQCPCILRGKGKGLWGWLVGRWAAGFHTSTGWLFQDNSKVIMSRDVNSLSQSQEDFFSSKLSVICSLSKQSPKCVHDFMLSHCLSTFLPLSTQWSHSYSYRLYPGYWTDLDLQHFGTRSFCTYMNISVLMLHGDLEVCCNTCNNVKICLECQTHAFWIKDKLGFLSQAAVHICRPFMVMQLIICEQTGCWASSTQPSYGCRTRCHMLAEM